MLACLLSVYPFVAALFLFWPGSGNLAGSVEGGRSAGTGERDGERSEARLNLRLTPGPSASRARSGRPHPRPGGG
jgi:hypothetical protein